MSLQKVKHSISNTRRSPFYPLIIAQQSMRIAKEARTAKENDKLMFCQSFKFDELLNEVNNKQIASYEECQAFAASLFHKTGHRWSTDIVNCGVIIHAIFRNITPYFKLSISSQGCYVVTEFYLDTGSVPQSNKLGGRDACDQ